LEKATPAIVVRTNLRPGDIGRIIYLHGILYAREYGFDHTFEPYVAEPLAAFVKRGSARERIWVVEKEGEAVGSVAVVDAGQGRAQLRWLILTPEVRSQGRGRDLVLRAVDFCRACGYVSVFLWTVDELTAAKKLYESMGFRRKEEKTSQIWGRRITEVLYELNL